MGKKALFVREKVCVQADLSVEEIKEELKTKKYEVIEVFSYKQAEQALETYQIHIVVLYLKEVLEKGEAFVKSNHWSRNTPLIVLSECTHLSTMVRFIKSGADDYLIYPFYTDNVVARIEAILRRHGNQTELFYAGEDYLVLDTKRQMVLRQNQEVHLTPNEYRILETFMRSPNRLFSREELIHYALHGEFHGYDRSIDTYIKSLRKKIEPGNAKGRFIKTVHGRGYRFIKDS